jgi:hypothetical protein
MAVRADASTQRAVLEAARRLAEAKITQERASATHIAALERITYTTRPLLWPPNGAVLNGRLENAVPPPAVFQGWGTGLSPANFEVDLRLLRDADGAAPASRGSDVPASSPALGVRYRSPVSGVLEMTVNQQKRKYPAGPVPQMGQTMVLPFTNGTFQQNAISATFSEDGTLTEASYGELASRTERASSAASRIASMGPGAVRDYANARNFGVEQQVARIRGETELLQSVQARRVAQAALLVSPDDVGERRRGLLEADTALKNAERLNVEAELALMEARRRLGSTTPSVISAAP